MRTFVERDASDNTIIDFYRQRSREGELKAEYLWYEAGEPGIEETLGQCVEPFIDALPETSALLRAVDLEGRPQKAVAEELGINYSTFKSQVQMARRQLRGLFDQCCHFSLDKSGNLADFDQKSSNCKNC